MELLIPLTEPLEKGFNPNEARGKDGKWAGAPGGKSHGERMADLFFGEGDYGKGGRVNPSTAAYQHPATGSHAGKFKQSEPRKPEDSAEEFSSGYTKGYKPERAELHRDIIDKLSKPVGTTPLDQLYEDYDESQPVAMFMIGGPAAGKTTYVHHQVLPNHRLQLVGSDEVKPYLPGYDPEKPGYVHRESVHVAYQHMDKCIGAGDSFCFDGTGLDVWAMKDAMNKARKNGFHVAVHFVTAPIEVALKRLEGRERKVPEHLVRSKHTEVKWAFEQLAPHADHVVEFDNSADLPQKGA